MASWNRRNVSRSCRIFFSLDALICFIPLKNGHNTPLVIKCLLIIQDYAPFRKGQAQGIYEHSGKIRALLPEYGRRKQPRRVGARPFSDKTKRPSAQGGGALSDGQRPRYNLHSSQVGCLQLTLLLPTSGRIQQRGGLQTIR